MPHISSAHYTCGGGGFWQCGERGSLMVSPKRASGASGIVWSVKRFGPWLVAVCLFGFPLFSGVAALLLPSNTSIGGIAYRAVVMLLAVPWVVMLLRGRATLSRTDFWWLMWLLWLGLGLRLFHEIERGVPMPQNADPIRVALIFASCVLPSIAMGAISFARNEGQRFCDVALFCCWLSTLVVVVASLFFARGYAAQVLQRASTDNINPILVGHLGVSCIILSCFGARTIVLFLIARVSFCLAGVMLLVASGSRGPFLALLVVAAVAVLRFVALRRRLWAPLWPSLALLCLFAPLWSAIPGLADTPLAERIAVSDVLNSRELGRSNLIPRAWEMFLERPLLGAGMSDEVYRQHPHNVIVEAFVAMGVVGGVLFCFALSYCTLRMLRLVFSRDSWSWIGFLFLQYLVFGMLSGSLYQHEQLWYLMALVIGRTSAESDSETDY